MMRRMFLVVMVAVCWKGDVLAEEVSIRPFVRGSFAAILEAGRGRPHIINFWSVGCLPCLAEMPLLKQMMESKTDIRLTMVSTDAEDDLPRVRKTLAKRAPAEAESWIFADAFVERLRYDVDRRWNGELPRTYLVGINGDIDVISGILDAAALKEWLARQGK